MQIPIINFDNIITLVLIALLYVGILILGRQNKKSIAPGILLAVFIIILIGHSAEYISIDKIENITMASTLVKCIAYDLLFVFLSVIGYLWIDGIEAKNGKRKTVEDGLSWFWSK